LSHTIDIVFGAAVLVAALTASVHAVIHKRDSRAAALWLAVIWLVPAIGSLLYLLIGINRVARKAAKIRRRMVRHRTAPQFPASEPGEHFMPLARLIERLVKRPLQPGNAVDPLVDGEHAFPAMLEAIGTARSSVMLASYIFDAHGIGAHFIQALGAAVRRGAQVRVLIDDVDARFSRSSAVKPLREAGVTVAVFNPPLVPARLHAANLRNHRKILVVDGNLGFTGGLNVDCRYWQSDAPAQASRDLQFRLRGPVVAHLAEVFANDWQFATGEALRGQRWFPQLAAAGEVLARGIEAGPDENFERLRWAITGGLNAAQRSVRILTPYFLPDQALISAVNAAAMRGVEVDIVIPAHSDLPHVHWAVFGQLGQVLDHGCRVWASPAPFDHSKLLVIDGAWSLIGSANWDSRSLRLNFELDVECYSAELGARLDDLVQARIASARPITLKKINARPFAIKLRDGVARLFAPYL
jgi:cardiolipin synthase